ncbi:hypothetical protein JNUCC42_13745 [Brevibacterium sp. JNUCC-42]|nr:hypothetical protein [Brevibacillus laterosporus]QOS97628.1 hypothetical protein JNUCC42_13745 [Brevibacterium sp. JNUCC-42]RAP27824.1 hypothetical protein C2W64_00643 [Brevibacillus laterosporus]
MVFHFLMFSVQIKRNKQPVERQTELHFQEQWIKERDEKRYMLDAQTPYIM